MDHIHSTNPRLDLALCRASVGWATPMLLPESPSLSGPAKPDGVCPECWRRLAEIRSGDTSEDVITGVVFR